MAEQGCKFSPHPEGLGFASQNKEEFMKTTALIMAGGKGERFWPKSRVNMPKQFLSLTDDGKTMIQLTVERISQWLILRMFILLLTRTTENL